MTRRRTLTLAADTTERTITVGLRTIGSLKSEMPGRWAAYDQDGKLLDVFKNDKAAGSAVFAAWAKREEAS